MLVCLLVNQHPSPLDDCPRFEDAIAFISVVLGSRELLDSKRVAALNAGLFTSVTPGAAFDLPALVTTWVLLALLKVTTGILVVLSWRMVSKPHVLPPPPPAAALPLPSTRSPCGSLTSPPLHACDRVLARPAAYAGCPTEHDRP